MVKEEPAEQVAMVEQEVMVVVAEEEEATASYMFRCRGQTAPTSCGPTSKRRRLRWSARRIRLRCSRRIR